VVDESGLPIRLLITPGQASDKTAVPALLHDLPAAEAAVADRGYDSDAVIALIQHRGSAAHIPSTSRRRLRRSVDPELYRQRSLVERFFCKLKQFRRIATRFDKLARNFLAVVALASARIWLRAVESTP
jgi:transposase